MVYAAEKPSSVIDTAIQLLNAELVLPRVVTTEGLGRFVGKLGDTYNMRLQGRTAARTQVLRATGSARTIVVDNLAESTLPVKVDTRIYNAIGLTDENLTLDIYDFSRQVSQPQVRAMAEAIENQVADGMEAATYAETALSLDTTDVQITLNRAAKLLDTYNIPTNDRILVVGLDIAEAMLNDDYFRRYDLTGDQSAVTSNLQKAQLRPAAGFRIIKSKFLGAKKAFALHPTAYAYVMGAPAVPTSAGVAGATTSADGIAMRWMRDYDATENQERSIFTVFTGWNTVADGEGTADGKVVRALPITMA